MMNAVWKKKTAKVYDFTKFCGFAIMIVREQYVNRLKNILGINVIKVITGLRRVGKTTLFKQFQQELKNSGKRAKYFSPGTCSIFQNQQPFPQIPADT